MNNKFNPDSIKYVDLGLPSVKLWATENGKDGEKEYFTYDEAKEFFGLYLPSAVDVAELYEYCRWEWDDIEKGYMVTGPNDNSIFLKSFGYRAENKPLINRNNGYYWTSCENKRNPARAHNLSFDNDYIYPLDCHHWSLGFSVHPVRESFKSVPHL